jgi:hypothetical protein
MFFVISSHPTKTNQQKNTTLSQPKAKCLLPNMGEREGIIPIPAMEFDDLQAAVTNAFAMETRTMLYSGVSLLPPPLKNSFFAFYL